MRNLSNIYPESEFSINLNTTNIATYGNFLVAIDWDTNGLPVYDLCTGDLVNTICLTGESSGFADWGLSYSPHTGLFYATDGFNHNNTKIYTFSPDDLLSTTCIDPIYSAVSNYIAGVTADQDGNIYAVESEGQYTFGPSRIVKFDPDGNIIATSVIDSVGGDGGYYQAIGIVYSETCNCLFVSTQSPVDDCVTQFNLDLTQSSTAVPTSGTGNDFSKGISIQKECCPVSNNLVIDTILCDLSYPSNFYLQDFLMCDGIICGGAWVPDAGNIGLDFEGCDQSVTINSEQACGSFTLSSDGSSPNAQCGAFTVTINIETAIISTISVTGNQSFCPGDALTDLVATTNSATAAFQWQMSSTACTGPWTDVAGATTNTYSPPTNLAATNYYQVVVSEMGGCATGTCDTASDCITVSLNTNCEAFDVALTKTVDLSSASLGSPVVFTITVENLEDAVTGATVNDVLPAGLTYNGVYTASTGTYDGTNWTIGNMAVGQTETIQITATADAEGVMNNNAVVTINETETDLTNNEDNACVSVPIQVCDNAIIDVDLIAEAGLTTYQWYKDDLAIGGAINQTYNATEVGTYTYTLNGAGPTGDCEAELCCPIVIEQISCCAPVNCFPITVTKLN